MLTVIQDPPIFGGETDTILLTLILVVLALQLAVALWRVVRSADGDVQDEVRRDPVRSLERHNAAIMQFMRSPTHGEIIERTILLEASLAAEIDLTMERFADLGPEGLRARYADFEYPLTDKAIDWIRDNLNRRNAGAVGQKLLDKVLGVANKMVGLPG